MSSKRHWWWQRTSHAKDDEGIHQKEGEKSVASMKEKDTQAHMNEDIEMAEK